MTEAKEKVVEAGIQLFFRYGVKRTTMNDLAVEAGVSRPTLYGVFSNKDEVLCAVIRTLSERTRIAIEAEFLTARTLSEKLDIAFEHAVMKGFDLLRSSADATDILAGFSAAAREEVAKGNEGFRALMEKILIAHEAEVRRSGLTHRRLSDYIQNSARGCRDSAKDKAHLRELLKSLKALVLA
jgi:AcrR family transcriptional regulator